MASRKVENSPWLTFYECFSEKVTKISVDFFTSKPSKIQQNLFWALAQGTSVQNFSEIVRAVWPELSQTKGRHASGIVHIYTHHS